MLMHFGCIRLYLGYESDMPLALLGAIVSLLTLNKFHDRQLRSIQEL
jgi:hypothetical protein